MRILFRWEGGTVAQTKELEVCDLVIFGNAPCEARGIEPSDCLSVEHVLKDHMLSARERSEYVS